jgi:hypothetical protein
LSVIEKIFTGEAWFGPKTMAGRFLPGSGSGTSRTVRQAKFLAESKYVSGNPNCLSTKPTGLSQRRTLCVQIGPNIMSNQPHLKLLPGKIESEMPLIAMRIWVTIHW